MNTPTTNYAGPEAKTRHDTLASSVVLAAMLASALCGVFVAEVDATLALDGKPAVYAAVEEARP